MSSTQPEALRLADELERAKRWDCPTVVIEASSAELRRLHSENASLAAALASSCDEQRHQLWESGGIAGCERARAAEQQRDALLTLLGRIREWHQLSSDAIDEAALRAAFDELTAKLQAQPKTLSQRLADAGFKRRPSIRSLPSDE